MEMRLPRARDKSYRWHRVRSIPITNSKSQVISWFGTSTDIKDHKRAAEAIARTNQDLENLVRERTEQLQMIKQLGRLGLETRVASSGKEALEILEQEEFDLVLMDVQMPGMNAVETTEIIRKREQITGKHLPILALTVFSMPDDIQVCLDAGMAGHISKPLIDEAAGNKPCRGF